MSAVGISGLQAGEDVKDDIRRATSLRENAVVRPVTSDERTRFSDASFRVVAVRRVKTTTQATQAPGDTAEGNEHTGGAPDLTSVLPPAFVVASCVVSPSCVAPGWPPAVAFADLPNAALARDALLGHGIESPTEYPQVNCIAAHNVQKMFRTLGGTPAQASACTESSTLPWLCTMRLAVHLWASCPEHDVERFCRWVNLPKTVAPPPTSKRTMKDFSPLAVAHKRAYEEVLCTAALLVRARSTMYTRGMFPVSVIEAVQWVDLPILSLTVPFGRYVGKPWESLSGRALHWFIDQDLPRATTLTSEYAWRDARYTAQSWLACAHRHK